MNKNTFTVTSYIAAIASTVVFSIAMAFLIVLSYEEYYRMLRLQGEVSLRKWIDLLDTHDSFRSVIIIICISLVVILSAITLSKDQNVFRYVIITALLTIDILCFLIFTFYFFLSVPALLEKSITFVTILTDRITTICLPVMFFCTIVAISIIKRNKGQS